MELTTIRELFKNRENYLDQKVTVGGWIRSIRDSKTFGFIVLNDGSFFETLQVVYHDKLENFAEISKLNVGAAIIVKGTLVATPQAKQPFEIQADEVTVEGASAPDYPLQKKRHGFEYLRTISHLRPRTNTFQAVFRVRSLAAYAIHKFFQERGFVYVHTPLITGSDCEGAGEMFRVTTLDLENVPKNEDGTVDYTQDFFGKETSLTVSGQLNGETYAQAFRNIYTFGPTFRAENSNTTRHAAEFWMIEPEIAFADLDDDMILAESMLKYVINYVLENAPEEMNFFNSFVDKGLLERLHNVVSSDFARVTYTEAVELLDLDHEKYDILAVRDYYDYVYDAEKLRTFSGKAYHKKKNHLNAFKKAYEGRYEYQSLSCGCHHDEIMAFLRKWEAQRDLEDPFHRDEYELNGIDYLLSNCGYLDYKMGGIYIDGELQAFSLGVYGKVEKMAVIHVEKANPDIRGLYPMICQQFLCHEFPDAELVNREDDMGLEGLRKSKMSYNPIYLEEKYEIRQK